jgi:hypothetical protein
MWKFSSDIVARKSYLPVSASHRDSVDFPIGSENTRKDKNPKVCMYMCLVHLLPSLYKNKPCNQIKSNQFIKPFLHQLISQSAVQKPSLKPHTTSNAGVETPSLQCSAVQNYFLDGVWDEQLKDFMFCT